MGNSFRQTIASIFSNPKMKEDILLSGHLKETIIRSQEANGEYLLIAQDTTSYNYTGHKQMEGLGVIQQKTLGIHQHNAMVMNELGTPLGLIHQEYWSRSNEVASTNKAYDGIESQKWFRGLSAVNNHLSTITKKKVLIQDREADIYDFFTAKREENVALITRVCQPRNLTLAEIKTTFKLATIGEHLTDYGTKTITINRNNKEVNVVLSIKASPVSILAGQGKTKTVCKGMSLVIAEEIVENIATTTATPQVSETSETTETANNIAPKDKIIWYLLTSLPVENQEDALRVITFYSFRWRIERLHYTLKSGGYNVERLQFDDIQTTINALVFYSVVSWQLLMISYLVKEDKEYAPEVAFSKQEVEILQALTNKQILTLKIAVLSIAKFVKFVPTKKQPMPGIKIMAEALERFYYIKMGFQQGRKQ